MAARYTTVYNRITVIIVRRLYAKNTTVNVNTPQLVHGEENNPTTLSTSGYTTLSVRAKCE